MSGADSPDLTTKESRQRLASKLAKAIPPMPSFFGREVTGLEGGALVVVSVGGTFIPFPLLRGVERAGLVAVAWVVAAARA